MQRINILVQTCHQKKQREVVANQDLEGTGESTHLRRTGNLINGDEYFFLMLLQMGQHPRQGDLDVRDGLRPGKLHADAKKGQVDLGALKERGQAVLVIKLGGEPHEQISGRIQFHNNPI